MACYLNERKSHPARPRKIDLKPLVLPPPGSLSQRAPLEENPLPERMAAMAAIAGGIVAIFAVLAAWFGMAGPD